MTTVAQITDALQGYDPQSVKVDDVVHIAKSLVKPLGNLPQDIEVLNLHAAAYRVLALDVVSPANVPAVDNSAMDGYAFFLHAGQVSQDLALTVSGLRLAGQPITGDEPTLQAGHCLHIMTGAPMPDGSNTVVPSELVQRDGDVVVVRAANLQPGDNRRLAGEDLAQGSVALKKGQVLHAAALGLLASLGMATVGVVRKPVVAYFSTGSEVQDVGLPPKAGVIYDSNRAVMCAMLASWGATVLDMGVIPDDPARLEQAFEQAATTADMVISSGGVSVGEADHTKAMMKRLGDVVFWRIAMRPGRPMAVGLIKDTPVFGLPGNPVAVMLTFLAFVRPALQRLMGTTPSALPVLRAKASASIRKRGGRTEYQRASIERNDQGDYVATVLPNQGSGVLSGMVQAQGLVVLAHDSGTVSAGDWVDVWMLDRFI
ncbi:MAG: molybdopterin molybdotransferase MoeA [Burkholderiaceae bacterium]|nr:molybdopterin molybdotransferase MoeA [Burkholderiaceae bacterium]